MEVAELCAEEAMDEADEAADEIEEEALVEEAAEEVELAPPAPTAPPEMDGAATDSEGLVSAP